MRTYTDDYKRSEKLRKYDIAVGNVQHVEDLRDRYNIQKGVANREIMAMLDAIDSGEELNLKNEVHRVFDGSLNDFLEFTKDTNRDQFNNLEDEVDILKRISEGLSKLRMDGVLNELQEQGYLTADEVNAMASNHIIDDAVDDLVTSMSKNILLERITNDLESVIYSIRDTFDDNVYKFNFEDNPVIEKLQDLGVVEVVRSRGIIHEDEEYNDGSSTDFRRTTSTPRSRRTQGRSRDPRSIGSRNPRRRDDVRGSYRRDDRRDDGIQLELAGSDNRRGTRNRNLNSSSTSRGGVVGKVNRRKRRSRFDRNDRVDRYDDRNTRRDTRRRSFRLDDGRDDYRENDYRSNRRSFRLDDGRYDYRDDRRPMPTSGTFSTLGFDEDSSGNRTIHINVDNA